MKRTLSLSLSLFKKKEKLAKDSLFDLFLKLVQMNFKFPNTTQIVYIEC